jgi:hypothetical protein
MSLGEHFLGVTCDHVSRAIIADDAAATDRLHEELGDSTLFAECRRNDGEQDFQFFALTPQPATVLYNTIPLCILDGFTCATGEPVFKIGRSTGLTIGTLASIDEDYTCPSSGFKHESVVEVNWSGDRTRFAVAGDCGALYCVQRGQFFVPIGIHRISGDRKSFGSNFLNIVRYFLELVDRDDFFFF